MIDDLRYALDPVAFSREICKKDPDDWQKVVLTTDKRALMNCTRQAGKSTVAAIKSLHRALFYPNSTIIVVSKTERQSKLLFKKIQDFYSLVPDQPKLKEDNKTTMKLANNSWIVALPGDGENIRGFSSVDLLIEDEAAFVSDTLYYSILPMLAVSRGQIILMSTPHGRTGHYFTEYTSDSDWVRIEIPWFQCSRILKEDIEEFRRSLGPWWFKQEFECQFMDTEDSLFSYEDIKNSFDPDLEPLFGWNHYQIPAPDRDYVKPLFEEK